MTAPADVPAPRKRFRRSGEGNISMRLFMASIIILVGSVLLVGRNLVNFLDHYAAVGRTQQAIQVLDATEASLEIEIGELNSYLATGGTAPLAAYRQAVPRLLDDLAQLGALPAADRKVSTGVENIRRAVTAQLLDAERRIGAPRRPSTIIDTGRRAQEAARRNIAQVRGSETAAFDGAWQEALSYLKQAIFSGAMGMVLFLALQCIVFARMDRDTARRREIEASLTKANAELENSLGALQRRNEAARITGEVGELLQSCRTTDEAVTIVLDQLSRSLPGVRVEIGLLRDEGMQVIGNGDGETTSGVTFDQCWALRRGQAHVFDARSGGPRCQHIGEEPTRSMCLPLQGNGESLGVLSLAETTTGSQSWEIAHAIADRLALSLANLRLTESLRNESIRDHLTGMFNRRYLSEHLAREYARARRQELPVSILILDIDHFKQFNDKYGHDGGDVVLKSFAELLARSIRGEDVASRYGGEEFAIVLSGATHEQALMRAEEIRKATERLQIPGKAMVGAHITTSVGVATFPAHGQTIDTLLGAADAALYLAKDSGRNRVVGAATLAGEVRQMPQRTTRLTSI